MSLWRPWIVAAWVLVAALATLAVAAALFRGSMLFGLVEMSDAEQLEVALAARVGLSLRAAELAEFDGVFAAHPVITGLHVVPAFLFMILAPWQFSSRIRTGNLRFHRWSGRVLVLLGVLVGVSGLFFGLSAPFGGGTEAAGIAVFGALFLWSLSRAVAAVRQGDLTRHREWMTRAFGIVLGVSMMRVVLSVLTAATGTGLRPVFGIAVWLGFGISAGAAELWIRSGREGPARIGAQKP